MIMSYRQAGLRADNIREVGSNQAGSKADRVK